MILIFVLQHLHYASASNHQNDIIKKKLEKNGNYLILAQFLLLKEKSGHNDRPLTFFMLLVLILPKRPYNLIS